MRLRQRVKALEDGQQHSGAGPLYLTFKTEAEAAAAGGKSRLKRYIVVSPDDWGNGETNNEAETAGQGIGKEAS